MKFFAISTPGPFISARGNNIQEWHSRLLFAAGAKELWNGNKIYTTQWLVNGGPFLDITVVDDDNDVLQ